MSVPRMTDSLVQRVELPNEIALEQVEQYFTSDEYSCDARVWECGVVLSYCLKPSGRSLLPLGQGSSPSVKRTVLDLGTGTGICGLAIAKVRTSAINKSEPRLVSSDASRAE